MPSQTHYISLTEAKSKLKTASDDTDLASRVRETIAESCRFLDAETGRRFDHYYDTGYLDAVSSKRGGNADGLRLWLDRDLISFDTVFLDGVAIDNSLLVAYPRWADNPYIQAIDHTDDNFTWLNTISGTRKDRISVTGVWGYGGRWTSLGYTATVADDTTVTLTASTTVTLDQYTVLKVGTEFFVVTADVDASASIPVERGYNGSTAIAHTAQAVSKFVADDRVRRIIGRMVSWYSALLKNPMYGTQTVGDISFPVDLTAFPKDIQKGINQLVRVGGF